MFCVYIRRNILSVLNKPVYKRLRGFQFLGLNEQNNSERFFRASKIDRRHIENLFLRHRFLFICWINWAENFRIVDIEINAWSRKVSKCKLSECSLQNPNSQSEAKKFWNFGVQSMRVLSLVRIQQKNTQKSRLSRKSKVSSVDRDLAIWIKDIQSWGLGLV